MKTIDEFLYELRQVNVKLWIEGDRLRYRAAKETLTPDLLAQIKERKAEILTFLRQASTAASSNLPPILPITRERNLPLSFSQQHLWFLHQFEPNSSANNMPVVIRLTGVLNVEALEESLVEIVRRHAILRTTFPLVDGQPSQVISPDISLKLPIIDLQEIPLERREAEAYLQATEEARQPFDLIRGPVLRVKLLRLNDTEHLLVWNMHCIVCDGSSADLFYQELTTLYAAISVGKPSPLPELPIQYADFACWQRQWLQGEVLESQLNYWKQRLGGNLHMLQLPTDHIRPPVQTYQGDRYPLLLPKTLHNALTILSQKSGTTLFMTLLAAFKTLLYRYSGQEDILVSFVNAGRSQVETERIIGFFSNALLLRTNLKGNLSFQELLSQVREGALEAYAHQNMPFEKLVEELQQPQRNQSRSPLFQVKFSLNPPWTNGRGMSSVKLPELTIESLFGYIYHGKTKFDLILVMREQENGLGAVFDYNADIFDTSTIARMAGHFQTLLEGIVADPRSQLSNLPFLTAAEQQLTQLMEWNSTQTNYSKNTCIHQLFEAQVKRNPDAIAVVFEDKQLTYWELNCQANQLARHLQFLGVGPEVLVGICMERSFELVVGLLGILKAGGAYVPLDRTYGREYLSWITEDAQLPIILTKSTQLPEETSGRMLTQQTLVEQLPESKTKIICLDTGWDIINQEKPENLTTGVTADNLAYVMYDCELIGKPKGVSVIHRGVVRLVEGSNYASLNAEEVFLQLASISFAASTFEIWGCLLNGARLAIFPAYTPSPERLGQAIWRYQVTTLWLTTGLFHLIVDKRIEDLKPVRQLLTGGDILSVSHVQKLLQKYEDCKLINVYTLTENTAFTCCYPIAERTLPKHTIPIGRPIANTKVYLLDGHLQPVPIGVIGELYIGGDGLARGYLNRPDLTEEKFILNPFGDQAGARLYKTGDLARYLPNGDIEFLGSPDRQVEIQGCYIEIGKVESALEQHPAVQQTRVIVREDVPGDKRLVAYVVATEEQAITSSELSRFLKQKLPKYMVPSVFILLDTLPLTPNGKVDYHILLTSDQFSQESEATLVSSRDELETELTKIWEKVLAIQPIGVTDNFFELGGNSLLAVRLFAQIEETFEKNLPLAILLQAPSIEQLANILRDEEQSRLWSPLVTIQAGDSKPPLFCIHGGGFNVLVYRSLAKQLGPDQPVYGLQARGMDGTETFLSRLEDTAADYIKQIRTVQPEGPYFLAGLSSGGNIALEMAQQLQVQGQKVALLALFDSFGPDSIKLLPPIPRLLSSICYASRYALPRFVDKLLRLETREEIIENLKQARAFKRMDNQQGDKAESNKLIKPRKGIEQRDKAKIGQLGINYLEHWINNLSIFILDHSPWAFFSPTAQLQGMRGSLPYTLKKLEEAHRRAQEAYVPQVYQGQITLFRASERLPGFYVDPQLGWGKIANAGVEIYEIHGHHSSIVESPILAEKLKICMARSQVMVRSS